MNEQRADRFPFGPAILIGIAVSLFLIWSGWAQISTRSGWDPDDQLRLVQLRDFLGGQSWFDTTQYRMNAPQGAPMHGLASKRVAIIGTGATAVQCVPHLARACQALYVFQRTPSSVDVRANAPIDPEWFGGIATPGWQQRWLENFTANQAGGDADIDLVQDGWTDLARRIRRQIGQR